MSDPSSSAAPEPWRVFVPGDPDLRAAVAVAAASHPRLVARPIGDLDSGADSPQPGDVVLLPSTALPDQSLELAARLGAYFPAAVVLVLSPTGVDPDLLGRAMALGACDVLGTPVVASELSLRLELARRRPRPAVEAAGDVPALTHQLTNVLAALRLTAFAVGRLPRPAVVPDSDRTSHLLDGRALASRIESEVDQAVLLVAELDHRARSAGTTPGPDGEGVRRWG